MNKIVNLLLLSFFVSGGVAHAATYYVSKTGSNNSSCTQAQSTSTPKLTVNAALGCLAAGDTLLVRGGTYDEGISWVPSGSSWNNKVRIANYPSETVWLKPLSSGSSAGGINIVIWLDGAFSYVEFDGINLDGRNIPEPGGPILWVSTNNENNPHHVRFKNAEVIAGAIGGGGAIILGGHTAIGATGSNEIINTRIHGGGKPGLCGYLCSSYGIYLAGPNNLVENVDIYDTAGAGIQMYNATGDSPDNNVIRNTRIHDITRTGNLDQVWGIIVWGNNNQIYNNLIYGINIGNTNATNAGIYIGDGWSANKVWNNTIYNKTNSGIYVGGANSSEVRNNIVYKVTGSTFVNNGSGTVQSNNLFGADPLFEDGSANNFKLQVASPAVNAGTSVAAVTSDFAGVARPQGPAPDIGAYEFGGQTAPPAAPAGLRIVAN